MQEKKKKQKSAQTHPWGYLSDCRTSLILLGSPGRSALMYRERTFISWSQRSDSKHKLHQGRNKYYLDNSGKQRQKNLPSTFVIKLDDKFKVLRDVRELRPSILEMRLEERSKWCRCQAEERPSILVMRLQRRLSDVTAGLKGRSTKLNRRQQLKMQSL